DNGHPDARGGSVKDHILLRYSHRHRVHEAIAIVAGMKPHAAAHGRHTERIAVAADARDHAGDEVARLGMGRRPEGESIEAGDGTRPHGEDIAQDAAYAGGSALIRLDVARVIV